MPQLIVSSTGVERIGNEDGGRREPAAMPDAAPDDNCITDVMADLDLGPVPDDVAEYARVRIGETDESRTRLLAELEDMIYGERVSRGRAGARVWTGTGG